MVSSKEKGVSATETLIFSVGAAKDGRSVKDFLSGEGFSSTLIRRVKVGGIERNGVPLRTTDTVHTGDILRVTLPGGQSENIEPIALPLAVVYEDEEILVVKKPAAQPTHPSRGNHLPTLANAVAAYFAPRPFVFRAITRLDRDTEGLVLIAKDALGAKRLSDSMANGEIHKRYLAVTVRPPVPREGEIDAPIARECEGALRRVVREDGKAALTRYRTLAENEEGHALVSLTPVTGRTHQLRVHMAHIGTPLDADFLYGTPREGMHYRLAAVGLEFPHPRTGVNMSFSYLPAFATEEFGK
ncbi:MAG TPA: RluA family pseudouridine synthase [Clostridiales bacterium]|nr:RluA family pseudouridine synthase [Clostridiales bacterium]